MWIFHSRVWTCPSICSLISTTLVAQIPYLVYMTWPPSLFTMDLEPDPVTTLPLAPKILIGIISMIPPSLLLIRTLSSIAKHTFFFIFNGNLNCHLWLEKYYPYSYSVLKSCKYVLDSLVFLTYISNENSFNRKIFWGSLCTFLCFPPLRKLLYFFPVQFLVFFLNSSFKR